MKRKLKGVSKWTIMQQNEIHFMWQSAPVSGLLVARNFSNPFLRQDTIPFTFQDVIFNRSTPKDKGPITPIIYYLKRCAP